MKRMKTVEEINSKGWYRLVKVFYITSFILCLLILVTAVVVNLPKKMVNVKNSTVTCTNYDLDYKLSKVIDYDFALKNLKRIDISRMNLYCLVIHEALTPEEENYSDFKLTEEQEKAIEEYRLGIVRKVEPIERKKDFIPHYVTYWKPSLSTFILTSIGSLIGILFVFELIRRIFYYIVLGKIKPIKQ